MHNLDGGTLLVFFVAVLLQFGGYLWFLAEAFRKSIPWGLAVLFIPGVALAFLATNFERAGKPFLLTASSVAILLVMFFNNVNFREAISAGSSSKMIAQVEKTPPAPVAAKITPHEVKVAVSKHAHQHAGSRHHHSH